MIENLHSINNQFKELELIREVPHRRAVFFCKFKSKPAILKIFSREKDYIAETKGLFWLNSADILTPKILFIGKIDKIFYIASERYANAIDVEGFIQQKKNQSNIRDVLNQVIEVNHLLFKKNLLQRDNYLKNYLVSGARVYPIDAGMIKKTIFFKRWQQALNLSLLFSKFDQKTFIFFIKPLKKKYFLYTVMSFMANVFRLKAIKNYKKKSMRSSTDFEEINKLKYSINKKRSFVFNFSDLQIMSTGEVIKNGNTCTVFKYKDFVIKRYNIKNLWHFFLLQFKVSRAQKSWQNANALELIGIPTPEPLAFIQSKFFFFKREAFYITRYQKGNDVIKHVKKMRSEAEILSFQKTIKDFFTSLKFYRIFHGDLKGTNIIVDSAKKLCLIDLDSVSFISFAPLFNYFHSKDKLRFKENWNQVEWLTKVI